MKHFELYPADCLTPLSQQLSKLLAHQDTIEELSIHGSVSHDILQQVSELSFWSLQHLDLCGNDISVRKERQAHSIVTAVQELANKANSFQCLHLKNIQLSTEAMEYFSTAVDKFEINLMDCIWTDTTATSSSLSSTTTTTSSSTTTLFSLDFPRNIKVQIENSKIDLKAIQLLHQQVMAIKDCLHISTLEFTNSILSMDALKYLLSEKNKQDDDKNKFRVQFNSCPLDFDKEGNISFRGTSCILSNFHPNGTRKAKVVSQILQLVMKTQYFKKCYFQNCTVPFGALPSLLAPLYASPFEFQVQFHSCEVDFMDISGWIFGEQSLRIPLFTFRPDNYKTIDIFMKQLLTNLPVSELYLQGNKFGNDGLWYVTQYLQFTQLLHLDLSATNISNIHYLMKALPLCNVTTLNVSSNCYITTNSVTELLLEAKCLRKLILQDMNFRDNDLKCLAKALKPSFSSSSSSSSLAHLDISNNASISKYSNVMLHLLKNDDNVTLKYLDCDHPSMEVEYYLGLNRIGRRQGNKLLLANVRPNLFPLILAKENTNSSVLYFVIRTLPHLSFGKL